MHRFRRGAALLVSGDFHERHAREWQPAPKRQTDFLWRKPQREATCRGNARSGENFGGGEARRVCTERFAPGHKRERHRGAPISRPSAATSAAVVPGAAEMAAPALMNAANAASVPLRDEARSATSGAGARQ